jgi:predicted membrane-bound spermidine synthase
MDETAIEIPEAIEIDSTQISSHPDMRWFYAFFFASGFCSLLYELVWMRLAMAQFGVTSTLTATFISVFMVGLGIGSWLAARWLSRRKIGALISPVVVYALTELSIGVLALAVPWNYAVATRCYCDLERTRAGLLSDTPFYPAHGLGYR